MKTRDFNLQVLHANCDHEPNPGGARGATRPTYRFRGRAREDVRRILSRAQAGFTLMELSISGALMALILFSGYLCLSSGVASRKMIESRSETLQAARVALNLMTADLRSACPLSKEIEFVGMSRSVDGIEADNVDFGSHHFTPQRPGEGDFCQMSYYLAKDPKSGTYALWRRRNSAFGPNPLSGGRQEELIRGVQGLKLEYYDGLDWYDTWGDPEGRAKADASFRERRNLKGLPDAVRITLTLENGGESTSSASDEPPMTFQTIARLYLAGRTSGATSSGNGAGKSRSDSTGTSQPNPPGQ